MKEFFVVANSFAAPFFSDTSTGYCKGATPKQALIDFAENYDHSAGLYSAALYKDANAYHKNSKPLARWLCNHEIKKQSATKGKASYSYCGHRAGEFEINGKLIKVKDPTKGRLVSADCPGEEE